MADTADPGAALPSRVQDWLFRCAGLPWNGAETTALICDLAAALQQTQAENETLRMQLVACSSAALMNTESTIGDRVTRENPYWSVAYADVCRAVDREIAHRNQLAEAEATHQRLREAVGTLSAQWRKEADDYPRTDYRAEVAAIAVQLCAKELEAALASPESAG